MLNLPAERLRDHPGHDVRRSPIERIKEADARRVTGCVHVRRVKIAEDSKGGRPPGIVDCIEVIRRTAASVPGSSEVNSKLVGVERAARAALDAQVDPRIQDFGVNSPGLRTPSAVFR